MHLITIKNTFLSAKTFLEGNHWLLMSVNAAAHANELKLHAIRHLTSALISMPSSEPVFNRNLRLWDIGSQDSLDKELDRLSASYPHRDSNSELKDSCWTLLYHGAHLAFPRRLHKIFQDGMWCRKNQRQKYSEGWFFFFLMKKVLDSCLVVSGGDWKFI